MHMKPCQDGMIYLITFVDNFLLAAPAVEVEAFAGVKQLQRYLLESPNLGILLGRSKQGLIGRVSHKSRN